MSKVLVKLTQAGRDSFGDLEGVPEDHVFEASTYADECLKNLVGITEKQLLDAGADPKSWDDNTPDYLYSFFIHSECEIVGEV